MSPIGHDIIKSQSLLPSSCLDPFELLYVPGNSKNWSTQPVIRGWESERKRAKKLQYAAIGVLVQGYRIHEVGPFSVNTFQFAKHYSWHQNVFEAADGAALKGASAGAIHVISLVHVEVVKQKQNMTEQKTHSVLHEVLHALCSGEVSHTTGYEVFSAGTEGAHKNNMRGYKITHYRP